MTDKQPDYTIRQYEHDVKMCKCFDEFNRWWNKISRDIEYDVFFKHQWIDENDG